MDDRVLIFEADENGFIRIGSVVVEVFIKQGEDHYAGRLHFTLPPELHDLLDKASMQASFLNVAQDVVEANIDALRAQNTRAPLDA